MTNFISVITVRIMGEVLVEEVTNTTTKKKKYDLKQKILQWTVLLAVQFMQLRYYWHSPCIYQHNDLI